jgi:hypothetical protein
MTFDNVFVDNVFVDNVAVDVYPPRQMNTSKTYWGIGQVGGRERSSIGGKGKWLG